MESRLEWLVKKPVSWLHWEPLRGGLDAHNLLAKRYPQAECFVHEPHARGQASVLHHLQPPLWRLARWTQRAPQTTPPPKPVEMLWANMVLHMAPDPQALLQTWADLLAPQGVLMFSCLGPDTLQELRQLYENQGWTPPSHAFTDMHDWGDMLIQSGFTEPVMDMERITLTYSSAQTLLSELREVGRNLHRSRFPGLRGKRWYAQLQEQMQVVLRDPADPTRLRLTFEVVYGHAVKAVPRLPVRSESMVSLDAMRATIQSNKLQKRTG
jgi:malonyl-CoA O-methyltransferase